MVEGRGANHGEYRVAARDRAAQSAQHERRAALGANHAVGSVAERTTATGGRQHARLRHHDVSMRRQHEVDPAGDREVAFTEPQTLTCKVHCGERRGACGVGGDRGSVQAEHVRNASCTETGVAARQEILVEVLGVVGGSKLRVVARGHADEHTGIRAAQ